MIKVTISEIAKESGKKPQAVLETCKILKIDAKTASSTIEAAQAERVMAHLISAVTTAPKPIRSKKTPPAIRVDMLEDPESIESLVRGYTKAKPPKWACPHCGHKLELAPQKRITQKGESKEGFWKGTFNDTLVCTKKTCGKSVIVSGEAEDWKDASGSAAPDRTPNFYYPKSCTPPLVFFALPAETPHFIAAAVKHAFASFFGNPKAALDALASVSETLRSALENGHKETAKTFAALRWDGKDKGQGKAAKEDLLKRFGIFAAALNELYAA